MNKQWQNPLKDKKMSSIQENNSSTDYDDFDEAEEKVLNISSIPIKAPVDTTKLTRPATPKAIAVQKVNGSSVIKTNN